MAFIIAAIIGVVGGTQAFRHPEAVSLWIGLVVFAFSLGIFASEARKIRAGALFGILIPLAFLFYRFDWALAGSEKALLLGLGLIGAGMGLIGGALLAFFGHKFVTAITREGTLLRPAAAHARAQSTNEKE